MVKTIRSPDRLLHDTGDPTTICGNSLFPARAREEYRTAFLRVMDYCFAEGMPGHVMEFGTFGGFTARIFAELMAEYGMPGSLLMFDSFEGFPETSAAADRASLKVARQQYWIAKNLATPEGTAEKIHRRIAAILPAERVEIYPGYFRETLPDAIWRRKAAVVHIDCDLFESALDVLVALEIAQSYQDGTVLLFDDFFCNRANPNFGERAALKTFLERYDHYAVTPWFNYSWGAAAFFLHDLRVTDQSKAKLVQYEPSGITYEED